MIDVYLFVLHAGADDLGVLFNRNFLLLYCNVSTAQLRHYLNIMIMKTHPSETLVMKGLTTAEGNWVYRIIKIDMSLVLPVHQCTSANSGYCQQAVDACK